MTASLAIAAPAPLASAETPTPTHTDAPFSIEDGAYPFRSAILTATGADLIAGDGNITHTSCSGPHQIMVWARNLKTSDSRICFKAATTGYLEVNIPRAYRIETDDRDLHADISIAGTTTGLDIPKDTSKAFGEASPTDPKQAVLLKLRIAATAPPARLSADPDLAFTSRLHIGDTEGGRNCSATVVDELWLATATSCFANKPGDPVPAGKPAMDTTASLSDGTVVAVDEIVPRADRDLALARLARPITGITPVKIGRSAPAQTGELVTAGFGRTATEWMPTKAHRGSFNVTAVDTATLTFTGKATGTDTVCKGDAGGPVLRTMDGEFELAGITSTSWQDGCLGADDTRSEAHASRTDDIRTWIAQTIDSTVFLRNEGSGRALDVAGTATAGAPVHTWDFWGGTNQQFTTTEAKELRVGGLCLDASGGVKAGADIIAWHCNGGANQKWNLNADNTITDATSGLCLEARGEGTTNGTPASLWYCNGGAHQRWSTAPHRSAQLSLLAAGAGTMWGQTKNVNGGAFADSWGRVDGAAVTRLTSVTSGRIVRVYGVAGGRVYSQDLDTTTGRWGGWGEVPGGGGGVKDISASIVGNTVHLQAIGGDGALWTQVGDYTAGRWNPTWSRVDSSELTDVTSVASGRTVRVYGVAGVRVYSQDLDTTTGRWGGWGEVPGGAAGVQDISASITGTTVQLHIIGGDGAVWSQVGDYAEGHWNPAWTRVGGAHLTRLTTSVTGATVSLFATGDDGKITTASVNTATGDASNWQAIPGTLTTSDDVSVSITR
ncbi:ricin-type beta-trefoil lectin domain protein [Streptomyces sp. NPDC093225]|uniref:ricin-type beta-trefoil lectin domain protein n=1 Tax=Streptomyces sp. NPDC093225 TaxID=3366034 RepID=UPI0038038FF7